MPGQACAGRDPAHPSTADLATHCLLSNGFAAFKTINLFGGPHRRFLFLGPAYGTTRHHYGHFCPIIGRHIKTEVFPHIEAFMAEFDSADTADTAAMIATKHKFGCAAAAPGNSAPGPPQRLPLVPAAVQAVGAKDCA
jgi:hypothetical protein